MEEDNLEERKKAIEKFSINRKFDDSSLSNEIKKETSSVPDKNLIFNDEIPVENNGSDSYVDDFDKVIGDKNFLFSEDDEKTKKINKNKRKNTILVVIIFFAALSHLIYKYVSVINKEIPISKTYSSLEKIKEIPEEMDVKTISFTNNDIQSISSETEFLKEDLREKQKQIAILEDRKEVLKRAVSSLSQDNNISNNSNSPVKKSSENLIEDSNLSKVWKIYEVRNSGQSVVLKMIGYDRYITVSIGDTIMDAGLIRSIRKENGIWILDGLKKRVN